ncbi:hypothetical protein [Thermomonas fusca]
METTTGQPKDDGDRIEALQNRVDLVRQLSRLIATGMANTACSFEELPPMQVHAFAATVAELLDRALAETGYPYK